ncbi:MAG TPA: PQQ-binding-like beta-propeller repeat protein [Pyrinomonadaceae bacterium]|nr:PQQ-binding-like beta-propeller repeat protein [Pyrinomonadaceae bacterium]
MKHHTRNNNLSIAKRFQIAALLLAITLFLPPADCLLPTAQASDPGTTDWPMWGGTADRNMVSSMKGIPTTWDVKDKKNVKWVAQLGSQTYGNAVVAGGMVFVGTNNEGLRDPKIVGDKGILMAFRESDGEFMWQMVHDKLAAGRVNDWPYQGVASSPLVEGDRVYYVSNRAELMCVDAQGFRDKENDGITTEKLTGEFNGDVVWVFDMMEEVGSLPHNLANSSPVVHGDLIYVSTSNGQDESHVNVPSPKAPAIIAVNKNTGKLVWEDNSVNDKILHGQWSSPTVGTIGGVLQVVHGQGDGWVRGYEALTGKKLWEFDTNPKESVWPKTRNEIISTPVIYDNKVYLANGQDPEHGEGVGHMYAIDGTKRGDITTTGMVWHYDKIRRSISTPAIKDGIIYQPDFSGFLHAIDAKTGKAYWTHDLFAAVWGSPILINGKLYLGDEDGDVVIMEEGKTKKVIGEINMGSSVYSTPVPANGVLYISNRNQLYALAELTAAPAPTPASTPAAKPPATPAAKPAANPAAKSAKQ